MILKPFLEYSIICTPTPSTDCLKLLDPPLKNLYCGGGGGQMMKKIIFSDRRNFRVKYGNITVRVFPLSIFLVQNETIQFDEYKSRFIYRQQHRIWKHFFFVLKMFFRLQILGIRKGNKFWVDTIKQMNFPLWKAK